MVSELAPIIARFVHGPKIHRTVPVADEVDAALPPNRFLAGAVEIGAEWFRLAVALSVFPDVLDKAALVTLGVAALKPQPRKKKRLARRLKSTRIRLAQG